MHLNCVAGKGLCGRAISVWSPFPTCPAALLGTVACEADLKVSSAPPSLHSGAQRFQHS